MPSVQILPHPIFSNYDLNYQHRQHNSNSTSLNNSNNNGQNTRVETIDDNDIPMGITVNTIDGERKLVELSRRAYLYFQIDSIFDIGYSSELWFQRWKNAHGEAFFDGIAEPAIVVSAFNNNSATCNDNHNNNMVSNPNAIVMGREDEDTEIDINTENHTIDIEDTEDGFNEDIIVDQRSVRSSLNDMQHVENIQQHYNNENEGNAHHQFIGGRDISRY